MGRCLQVKTSNANAKNNLKSDASGTLSWLMTARSFSCQTWVPKTSHSSCWVQYVSIQNINMLSIGESTNYFLFSPFPQTLSSHAEQPKRGPQPGTSLCTQPCAISYDQEKLTCHEELPFLESFSYRANLHFPSTWTDFKWKKNQLLLYTLMGG